jgi:hypothetical protein
MTAAFTIVRNEPFFLPLWLAYYARHCDAVFVLDHGSDDGSTSDLPCEVVPVAHEVCYDFPWLVAVAETFQRDLFRRGFETVLYSDVDEFLCHPLGLRGFLRRLPAASCRAQGYQLVQQAQEAPYEAARSILQQRGWWRREKLYDKTLVAREPLAWDVGFHYLTGKTNAKYAEDLTLVHLHWFDREVAQRRHAAREGWRWAEEQREARNGEQWTLDAARLEAYLDGLTVGAEPVAEWLKERGEF